jgi:hypothetical protein
MIHPDRVVLLRGNHEFEYQNGDEHYDPCFLQNCEELFTKSAAKKIWAAFNSAFEWLVVPSLNHSFYDISFARISDYTHSHPTYNGIKEYE